MPNQPIIASDMPGSSGDQLDICPPAADKSSKSPCSPRAAAAVRPLLLRQLMIAAASHRLPLPIDRADAAASSGRCCRPRHAMPRSAASLRARPTTSLRRSRAASRRRASRHHATRTSTPRGRRRRHRWTHRRRSTPIGRAAQRGFVQSGFNDVPHPAAPASQPRGTSLNPHVFRAKSATNSGMKSATDSDLISAIPI